MTDEQDLKNFEKEYPYPDKIGIESLFKFSKFDIGRIQYLEELFVLGKLYHSLPGDFNDPFECKPHFNWSNNPSQVRIIHKHLVNVALKNGHKIKEAESLISDSMKKSEFMQESIYDSVQKTLSKTRICCFTTKKENLLFWSHYADSHKGFCVEYNATLFPISSAYKVKYENKYPVVIYPSPPNALGLKPVLIKSKEWAYEEEFRTIFVPYPKLQPTNDGASLILNGSEMKNVYLGAKMDDDCKDALIDMINRGPFNPGIWDVSLSKTSFKLEFDERQKA